MSTKSLRKKRILLVGNPNVGKSTVFNLLCNKNQKTGNYSGVTVASYSGRYNYDGEEVEVTDLPGSYTIYASSKDEALFSKYIIEEISDYDGVVYISDALNFRRSLFLFYQIKDLGVPLIMLLNQIDLSDKRGVQYDIPFLENICGVKIITANAKKNKGILKLKDAIKENAFTVSEFQEFIIPSEYRMLIDKMAVYFEEKNPYKVWLLIAIEKNPEKVREIQLQFDKENTKTIIPKRLQVQENLRRYQTIDKKISPMMAKSPIVGDSLSSKIDRFLVHPVFGYLFFFLVLTLLFQMVYFLAEYPMNWIDEGFSALSTWISNILPKGPLNSLVSHGIIPGVGGIMIFVPQIGILLYALHLLEDSGYMARIVFLMDRILRPFGLNGKSIVPLVCAMACAIPAVMSTRNIENTKERLVTILVTPFMTCSARLPVYSIIISLVVSDGHFFGIKYRAMALIFMYFFGFFMAVFSSWILKSFIENKNISFLVMDLPTYKSPQFLYNLKMVGGKVKEFILGAGKVIFSVSVILWCLSYFGPKENFELFSHDTDVQLEKSYLGRIGKIMEPAVEPLGYNWKMGISILSSFVAREVFVGTMATLYSLDEDTEEGVIIQKMRNDTKANGEKVFTLATGLSILVFYAFAMQCISTIAVVYRETKSAKWTFIQTLGMTVISYIASLIVYQVFSS